MDIVDLNAERNRRVAPDPEFIKRDDFGREMFTFLLGYEFDGGSWSTQLWAYDEADAKARVQAMRESLSYEGKLFSQGILA